MSYVQIDDFECPYCNKITIAELNVKTGKYRCLKCGRIEGEKQTKLKKTFAKLGDNINSTFGLKKTDYSKHGYSLRPYKRKRK